jgi:tetratricopeptide (TPR) repeat protein
MTEKEINITYTEICNNLVGRKLKPAFKQLEKLISENNLGTYYDEYRNLEETYRYMLKYTVEGIKDPERQKIYRKLIVSVFELTDKVNEALHLKYSSSVEYEKKRVFAKQVIDDLESFVSGLENYYMDDELKSLMGNQTEPGAQTETPEEHQRKMYRLFYHVWFSDELKNGEKEILDEFIGNPHLPAGYRSFIVAAGILSLQRFFDPQKFALLFDAYGVEEPEINQRALVGLLINFYKYDLRLSYFPAITGRLKILNENPEFKRNIERVIVQFIRSKETEKIQQKIRDEIIPEMIRISPNFKDKINLDSLMEEGLGDDKNPEWEEIFKDSPGLMDKMEEFSELQMEGADVFMGSFSMLKSFPFFNEIGNWFIPFYTENPAISNVVDTRDETNRKFVEIISSAPILCNSDKYSFCFSMQNLPEQNREFLAKGMEAEMGQLEELKNDEELTSPGRKAEFISNQFIQDLYRFYKIHPRKADFEDIFNWRFDFHNKLTLGDILKEDVKVLRNIAEYYFAKNYFEEAAEIYGLLLEEKKDGELYQKLAYCHQKQGDFKQALDGYLKAELYDLNRLWNLKKIALCYRNLKKPDKALEYYKEAEKLDPESLNNQLNIGHCYLELEKYEEALKCYFKVEYLAPGNKKVWRPIAWCSFLSGKKEQAEKYFMNVIENEPGKHDFMNMGHVQWSIGKRMEALEFYKRSISEAGFSESEFLEVFEEDLPHLINQGIDNEDVPIMLDQLRYFLEES